MLHKLSQIHNVSSFPMKQLPKIYKTMNPSPCYHIGQVFRHGESIRHEFKEFCMKCPITEFYSHDEIENIVRSGHLPNDFNDAMDHNMDLYFKQYFPKYAACFSATNIDGGILTIGVNDYSEITGIPYVGEMNARHFKRRITNCLKHIRACPTMSSQKDPQEFKREYVERIKIKIVELDTTKSNLFLSDVSEDLMKKYEKQKKKYDEDYIAYLAKRDKWLDELNLYSCNLNKMINNHKNRIHNYIQKEKGKHFAQHMMQIINSHLPLPFPNPDILKTDWKDNHDNFLYWLFEFKDNAIRRIGKTLKPLPPKVPRTYNAPFTILTQLSDLRYRFIKNTPDIKYYIVQIYFPGNQVEDEYLQFYNPYRKTWNSRSRSWNDDHGPCCIFQE